MKVEEKAKNKNNDGEPTYGLPFFIKLEVAFELRMINSNNPSEQETVK